MSKLLFVVLSKTGQFVSLVISKETLNSFLFTRISSILLLFALIAPIFFINEFGKTKAQTNFPLQQPAPITAPPEPYITLPGANSAIALPAFTAIESTISSGYSTIAASITGPVTPEGLGAATPPPTITERFTEFFAPLFITSGTNVIETKETKENDSNEPISTALLLPTCSHLAFDFDGDCLADIGRWQPNSFEYKVYNSGSSTYTTLNLGSSGSKIAPADFDGDDKFDMTVFSAGAWTVRKSSNNTNWNVTWGTTGDLPVAADYDGDGTADFAIYRPSTNTFWVLTSSSGYASYTSTALGTSGDIVVPGDYDGDGKADCAVFRPSNGHWYNLPSSGGSIVDIAWGVASDVPSPGDFDSDGKTDRTVFRPSTGTWYVYKSLGGSPNYFETNWGNLGDQPAPADYDGDGTSDMAVYRPTTGTWWILSSLSGFKDSIVLSLGTTSDIAVPSAYLKQSGAELSPDQLSPARLAPINATGETNYYSRNSAWNTALVDLPGRSGMNLNIGMSYNSLVWTKVGSVMAFDMDKSNIAPGFNFGFSRIEAAYVNSQTSILSYLMVTPSGARTEFRQTAASDTYEAADSSYIQVKVNNPGSANNPTPIEDITLTVIGTDGMQMSYAWIGNAYRCTQIKDRNGNFITISNNTDGQLTSVTDTLGRVLTVNYDSYARPSSITQNWQTSNGTNSTTTTHAWASFVYTTKNISTAFASTLSVYGPANNTSISVLDKVIFSDNSYTKFDYNNYGQVYKTSNYAYNNDLLNYKWHDINAPSSGQLDCPRFTQTRTKAAHFNNDNEVIVNNTFTTGASYTPPGSSSVTGTKIEILTPDSTGAADALVTRIWSASSGWAEGLPALTKDYATESSTLTEKRWSWTAWTQENDSIGYIKNPRVTETQVGDGTTTKRTTKDYLMQPNSSSITQYGLVSSVKIYAGDQSTVLKTQAISYNDSSNYISRRIIGLPSETKLYEGTDTSGTLVSKITYDYDQNGYAGTGQSVTATQHNNANFGTGFSYRGNPTRIRRWDVSTLTTSTNDTLAVGSEVKYNITGSPISQTDPRGRVSTTSYTDAWNDSVTRNATYAYPTTITDSGGFVSTMQYRHDIGANVWARSPTPSGAGNTYGKTSLRTYDDTTGRPIKEKIANTGLDAYTRFEYPTNGVSVNIYSTVVDANDDSYINGSDEVSTEILLDGAGRVRKTRTEKPGSSNYIGKQIEYNILGQIKRETIPTEVNSSWVPTGDDYRLDSQNNVTFLWLQREYDWKGRVTKETNTDGTDKLYSYEGCGCAGNQITTIKGEVTTAIDNSGNEQTTKRRTQKLYTDILGRNVKTETWDLDGGGNAPYSTTVNTYNGRDQITSIVQYAGSDSSSTHQDTTMTYDGHGRILTRHLPEEASNTYTQWSYKNDDKVATVTDPRGATTTYKYGHIDDSASSEYRELPTKISYSVPQNSTIIVPADTNITYDAAGNRIYMSDGTGNLTYSYDELSRLKTETKNFADTLTNAPIGGYELKYNYNLNGGLKSIEDPYGSIVTYDTDKLGRTTGISGSGFYDDFAGREITSYVSDINYRAFGKVKSMAYTTDAAVQVSLNYNTRLQPSSYEVNSSANTGDIQNVSYSYYNDGSTKEAVNSVDTRFSQYYDYDFAGRLKRNEFGGGSGGLTKPYKQTLGYDAFDNITSRSTWTWGSERSFEAGYTNNRKTTGGYQLGTDTFDAPGNVTQNTISSGNIRKWKFDAAGKMTDWEETLPYIPNVTSAIDQGSELTFDGDGRAAKQIKRNRSRINGTVPWNYEAQYQIYSSVTGQKITGLSSTGQKVLTLVYMGSSVIAEQKVTIGNKGKIVFKHNAPITGSIEETEISGEISSYAPGKANFEALGAVIPPEEEELRTPVPNYQQGGTTDNPENGCTNSLDGSPMPCSAAAAMENHEMRLYGKNYWKLKPELIPFGTHPLGHTPPNLQSDYIFADNVRHDRPGLRLLNRIGESGSSSTEWIVDAAFTRDNNEDEAKKGFILPDIGFCGVNPVTGEPGMKRKPYNGFGTIRDDSIGNGEYDASRDGKGSGHKGIDISGLLFQPVVAFLGGVVTRSEYVKGYGNTIEITHPNGLVSKYHHLEKLMKNKTDSVKMGDVVGLLGQTGNAEGTNPHVDFEVFLNGVKQNPVTILNSRCPK